MISSNPVAIIKTLMDGEHAIYDYSSHFGINVMLDPDDKQRQWEGFAGSDENAYVDMMFDVLKRAKALKESIPFGNWEDFGGDTEIISALWKVARMECYLPLTK
jgi:hypothetical protein